jgi:hypothetical protein
MEPLSGPLGGTKGRSIRVGVALKKDSVEDRGSLTLMANNHLT